MHMIKASTSKEYTELQKGVPISKDKQHANWLQNSHAFERYYYKPVGQAHDSTQIQVARVSAERIKFLRPSLRQPQYVIPTDSVFLSCIFVFIKRILR